MKRSLCGACVDEREELYCKWPEQDDLQWTEGTKSVESEIETIMRKGWDGVPSVMFVRYVTSFQSCSC